jgi:cation diffusion facilitator CzcD-associated flavoprotein CzcO
MGWSYGAYGNMLGLRLGSRYKEGKCDGPRAVLQYQAPSKSHSHLIRELLLETNQILANTVHQTKFFLPTTCLERQPRSIMRQDIGKYVSSLLPGSTDSYKDNLDVDILIVGAGFGGVYLLHQFRKLGYSVKIYEAGTDLGGIWHWNCYPGARVDSAIPVYEYSIPEVWDSWTWTEKYPGWAELRQYFNHVDKTLGIKKDVAFNTKVVGANFNQETNKWTVQTEDGRTAYSRYFILATGFAAKRHFPDWPGMDKFKGTVHHSSFWPNEGVDVRGKKVAVVGTGSTGVQIAQESAPDALELTVFQRTPNLALPMRQAQISKEEQEAAKHGYPQFFKDRLTTFAGFPYDFSTKNTFDDNEEEREAFYEKLWENGGFEFWLATYKDMLFDAKANRAAYDFWNKKTRARINDPVKRDILAPVEPPHPFGTKRPSLEQNYYEQFNRPNVHVVDISANPVKEVVAEGIITSDGKLHEIDIIALATGFDSVTGGMKNMGLRDVHGTALADAWANGTFSYLGMTRAGYPNMFFLYGPHGPTAFSNGPTCVEVQGDWIIDAIKKIEAEGIKSIDPQKDAEVEWKKKIKELNDKTLFPLAKSWYMGANIPGKTIEQLNWPGGMPLYEKETRAALDGWNGYTVVKA